MKQKPECSLCTTALLKEQDSDNKTMLKYKVLKIRKMSKEFENDDFIDLKCNNSVLVRLKAQKKKVQNHKHKIEYKWVRKTCDNHILLIKR